MLPQIMIVGFVTDTRRITDDGILSEQALKGKQLSRPSRSRPWSHELSGRLNSLTSDVAADRRAFVAEIRLLLRDPNKPPKTLQFAGVAFNSPRNLRNFIGEKRIATDVFHTPINPPEKFASPAHADFVTIESSDDDLDEIRTWLQENLKVLRATQVHQMPSICSSSQAATIETAGVPTTAQAITGVIRPR
jgi:hypothetical protein